MNNPLAARQAMWYINAQKDEGLRRSTCQARPEICFPADHVQGVSRV